MELHFPNNGIKFLAGIASSIARDHSYSWSKTISYARELKFNTVQLYLPDFKNISKAYREVLPDIEYFKEVYFHLPPDNKCLRYIHPDMKNCLFVQHERFINIGLMQIISDNEGSLGVENDNPLEISTLINRIEEAANHNVDVHAVIDPSRYYHYFYSHLSIETITAEIIDVLKYCSTNNIPVILHIIDHNQFNAHRSNWTPLFEGVIPWPEIFEYIIRNRIQLRSVIFEYEIPEHTRQSINNLIDWFNNYHQNSF
ncbi:MAG: hypothetical protein AB7T22_07410 [Calditrichaceae bacterium]